MKILPQLGTRPSAEIRESLRRSPQYNGAEEVFQNRRPHLLKEMRKRVFTFKLLKDWFSRGVDRTPSGPLPQVKPDLAEFVKPSKNIKLIWFGHSTVLLNVAGKIILIDPVFGKSASPFDFIVPRFQPPALSLAELPEIDVIVLSHDHYDHLDMTSVVFFRDKKAKFVVPLGVGSHLAGWGISSSRTTELDWWQTWTEAGIDFIATPAQHFSGRDGLHENETLWASWVIKSASQKIYFSGDSGYDVHFKDIGDKYGPFDIAFVENGQYNDRWPEVHVHPEESVQAAIDLRALRYFPIHWGMFVLSMHTWYEPIARASALAKERNLTLVSPQYGQVVELNDGFQNKEWWEGLK